MKKIFVVEDNDAIREVLEIVLSEENYDVQSYSTVKAFSDRNKSEIPDLYIFDVMLPDGSGINLCEDIRNDSEKTMTPILMMSAHAELRHLSLHCQPDDFITKPFDIDQFVMRVNAIIRDK